MINETENTTGKSYEIKKYVQSLATEVKPKKLFMKELQLYLLKMSVSEMKCNSGTVDSTI